MGIVAEVGKGLRVYWQQYYFDRAVSEFSRQCDVNWFRNGIGVIAGFLSRGRLRFCMLGATVDGVRELQGGF